MLISVVAVTVLALVLAGAVVALASTRAKLVRLGRLVTASSHVVAVHEARQEIITGRSGLCAFELDLIQRTLAWSPEVAELHGIDVETFDGTFSALLALAHEDGDATATERGLAQLVLKGEGSFAYRTRRPDGDTRWIEVWAREVVLPGETHSRIIGVAGDITDRKQAEANLQYVSRHDALTGLPNRSALIDHLGGVVGDARPGALLLLDLDGFKEINDALGHGIGDQVLVEIARRIQACVRDDDTVARLGGDEFAIVLHDVDSPATGVATAQRILQELSAPVRVSAMALHVSGSIGISLWPVHGSSPSSLLKHADVAMYRAKGRANCAVVYTADHEDDRAGRLALVAELRAAIEEGTLDVHYQPIVEMPHDRVVGLEALARWRRPNGDVGPNVFVPLAEQFGLINELTRLIMGKAMDEARRWQADGVALRVSVNISPRVLSNPAFAEDVKCALLASDLPASSLILEITETALAEPTTELMLALHELRAMGVSVALDDFGAGYSSLGTLTELPVDILKIDRSFLSRLPAPNAIGVVRAIIEMARHLGIDTVAEGVEGEAAASVLRDLGCGFAQGYHFGRPAPVVDIRSLVDSQG